MLVVVVGGGSKGGGRGFTSRLWQSGKNTGLSG